MNANIRCLLKACEDLTIPYQIMHPTKNLVLVNQQHLFTNWATPLISHAIARLLTDKDYTQAIFGDVITMPKTKPYLTPQVEDTYAEHLIFKSISAIVEDIEDNFTYPLIIKRNSGTHGQHVFIASNSKEAQHALQTIFNEKDKHWDFIALVQEYIKPTAEFRLIALAGQLELTYLKDISKAEYRDNLSPLHWQNSRSVLIKDPKQLNRFSEFISPIFSKLPLAYCGLDVIEDCEGKLYLIEINGSPGFDLFTRDNGDEAVVDLYKKILKVLTNISSHS